MQRSDRLLIYILGAFSALLLIILVGVVVLLLLILYYAHKKTSKSCTASIIVYIVKYNSSCYTSPCIDKLYSRDSEVVSSHTKKEQSVTAE